MDNILATVELKNANGLPKDSVMNTFPIFNSAGTDVTDARALQLVGDLSGFYSGARTNRPIAQWLSPEIRRTTGGVVYRLYDLDGHLDGSPHGSPFYTYEGGMGAAGAEPALPSEVAAVITTRGVAFNTFPIEGPGGTRPRQRHTGRNYIGPLNTATMLADGFGTARLNPGFVEDLLDGAHDLAVALSGHGFLWNVWSRVDATLSLLTQVEVDNAFDTQRRRGCAPTARTIRALAP